MKRFLTMMCAITMSGAALSVEYNEGMCSSDVISTFIKTLIQDYLHFRHPFMKTCSENGYVLGSSSRYRIVEIQI